VNASQIPSKPDIHELVAEIERYLVAVSTFRAEGHEPSWRPERPAASEAPARRWSPGCPTPPIP